MSIRYPPVPVPRVRVLHVSRQPTGLASSIDANERCEITLKEKMCRKLGCLKYN